MANPSEVHAEDPADRSVAVAKEHPSTPRDLAGERADEQFEAIALEMENNIRLLDDPQYLLREKAQKRLMESARKLFRSMNPLPIQIEARWGKMMDCSSRTYTLEQRIRLKNILSALEYEGLFRETRVPLEPDATMDDVLKTLRRQIGVELRFPPTWKDFEKIFNQLRGKDAVPFAILLYESCRAGNFIPVLEADGVTITLRENTTNAQIFLNDGMLCVLEPFDAVPGVSERLSIFPDPQESIASVENAATIEDPQMLVEAFSAGSRQWNDEKQLLAPRKLRNVSEQDFFSDLQMPKDNSTIVVRVGVMRNRRTWEVPLDETPIQKGIQAISATNDGVSQTITVTWRSSDPFDAPQICWSEMPVSANEYEAVDAKGKHIETTASPIQYRAEDHSFSIELKCSRVPATLCVRGYTHLSLYKDGKGGENIPIRIPNRKNFVPRLEPQELPQRPQLEP